MLGESEKSTNDGGGREEGKDRRGGGCGRGWFSLLATVLSCCL